MYRQRLVSMYNQLKVQPQIPIGTLFLSVCQRLRVVSDFTVVT